MQGGMARQARDLLLKPPNQKSERGLPVSNKKNVIRHSLDYARVSALSLRPDSYWSIDSKGFKELLPRNLPLKFSSGWGIA